MKILLLIACLIIYGFHSSVEAQFNSSDSAKFRKNSVYLELGGLGLAYSLNYDHILILNKKPVLGSASIGLGFRIGFSTFKMGGYFGVTEISRTTTLPLEAYFTIGNKFNLELGGSNIFIFEEGYDNYSGQSIRLGGKYRGHQGFIMFLGGALLFNVWSDYGVDLYPYLGFGYSF